jgi:hypothetical protein
MAISTCDKPINANTNNFQEYTQKRFALLLESKPIKTLKLMLGDKYSKHKLPKPVCIYALQLFHRDCNKTSVSYFVNYYLSTHLYRAFSFEQYRVYEKHYKNAESKPPSNSKDFYALKFGKHAVRVHKIKMAEKNPYDVSIKAIRLGVSLVKAQSLIDEHKQKTNGSLATYINRHGLVKGKQLHALFARRSANTQEKFITKYGTLQGKAKWKIYLQTKDSSSLTFFVKKYGKKLGTDLFNKKCVASSITYDTFVSKYGDTRAPKKYKDYVLNKTRHWYGSGRGQKITIESRPYFSKIRKFLDARSIEYVAGIKDQKEYRLWNRDLHKIHFYDFYIPCIKHIIEFDGHTHPSPLLSRSQLSKWRCFMSGVSAKTRLMEDRIKEEYAIKCGRSVSRIHIDQYKEKPVTSVKKILYLLEKKLEGAKN